MIHDKHYPDAFSGDFFALIFVVEANYAVKFARSGRWLRNRKEVQTLLIPLFDKCSD